MKVGARFEVCYIARVLLATMTTESVSSVGSTHSSAMLLNIVTSDEDKGNTTSGFQER